MSNVSDFNTTASGNDASPPDGFPEGQAASTVNNAARELMAAIARWYGDTQGSLVTGGTGNAYTLTSNSGHAALADQSMLVFRADRANTGSATLAVDSLAAKTIKAFGNNLTSGDIKANEIIAVVYNSNNDVYDLISLPGTLSGNTISNEGTALPSILSDTKANRPSAGTEGRWFYATDEKAWDRDTGSSWEAENEHTSVALGGAFSTFEEVVCVRRGYLVTITSDGSLDHSDVSAPTSATGAIPSGFRPSSQVSTIASFDAVKIEEVRVASDGTLTVSYRDYGGTGSPQTSTIGAFSITYAITGEVT